MVAGNHAGVARSSRGFRRRQLITAALAANAMRPPANYWLGAGAMMPGWLTGELAPHLLALTAADVLRELIGTRRDRAGLLLAAAGAAGLGLLIRQSLGADRIVEQALRDALGDDYRQPGAPRSDTAERDTFWRQLVWPFRVRNEAVEVLEDLPYGGDAELGRLDIYRPRSGVPAGAPVLIHVHGGMWMFGDKKWEGAPLLSHLASRGWVCFNVNYRLAPKQLFPAQIVDVKRAVAWVREHAAEYGADPSFIAITGGSAGGHLAALAATSAGDYQPGFEDADTAIQAVIGNYGIYDFAAASGTDRAVKRRDRFLAKFILKKDAVADRADFEAASPAVRVSADAPPFFVIHGTHDTGVEAAESRYFVDRLRGVSRQPVAYAELPGAQHAFDIFPSIRSIRVLRAKQRFLDWSLADYRARQGGAKDTAAG